MVINIFLQIYFMVIVKSLVLTNDKGIQTDAFCLRDVITDSDVLCKLQKYDSILSTMIGSTFIISDVNRLQTDKEQISEVKR